MPVGNEASLLTILEDSGLFRDEDSPRGVLVFRPQLVHKMISPLPVSSHLQGKETPTRRTAIWQGCKGLAAARKHSLRTRGILCRACKTGRFAGVTS